MLLITSSTEHANAVWVKNEWSRFLDIMKEKKDRRLYPLIFRMQPEDLPVELSVLQAQNIMKMGFLEELCDGLDRVFHRTRTHAVQPESLYTPQVQRKTVQPEPAYQSVIANSSTANTRFAESMTRRGYMSLEDGDWDNAARQFKSALEKDSRYAQAYIGKLMAQNRIRKERDLSTLTVPLLSQSEFQQAYRYASPDYKKVLDEYVRKNKENEKILANRIFEKVEEMIRFCDPVSDETINGLELEILNLLNDAETVVQNVKRQEEALAIAEKLCLLLQECSSRCRVMKYTR